MYIYNPYIEHGYYMKDKKNIINQDHILLLFLII